jgi:tetratricopeptide (TPR) repeat protein
MAETVCGPADEVGGDVFDRLGELVDQSLIRVDDEGDEPRFAMLETIREFARERLDARGETDSIGRRHAEAMTDLAREAAPLLSGQDQRVWLERLEREHDNFRAVLDRSTARPDPEVAATLAFYLWRFWQQRGYLREARARFDAMAAMGWVLEPVTSARFAEAFGGIAYWQSDQATATAWYQRALDAWRAIGDKPEIANALFNRSYADLIVIMQGEVDPEVLESGRAMLEEALALYRDLDDAAGEGNILWGLGSYYYFTADAATAEGWYERALALHRSSGQRTMEAWSLHMIALSEIGQRRFDDGLVNGRHALQHFYEAGDVSGVTLTLDDLALVAVSTGDHERAGRLWGAARHLQQTTGTMLADYVDQNFELFGIPRPRDVLSAADLDRLAAEGASMGLDEVVAYALDQPGGAPAEEHGGDD